MDKNRFNAEVRPYVTEIPIGSQGIAFDRLDLDAWADDYKSCNGHPGKMKEGGKTWGRKSLQDSKSVVTRGTSGRQSEIAEYEKARERAISLKPRDT